MNSIVIVEKVVILMFSFGTDSLQAQWEQVSLQYFYQMIIYKYNSCTNWKINWWAQQHLSINLCRNFIYLKIWTFKVRDGHKNRDHGIWQLLLIRKLSNCHKLFYLDRVVLQILKHSEWLYWAFEIMLCLMLRIFLQRNSVCFNLY